MHTTSILLVLAAVSFTPVFSSPTAVAPSKRQTIDDTTVLNFALTLEHLENNFYTVGLGKFDEKAFTDAGLPVWAYGRFSQVADHEKTHVQFLSNALGDKAVQPCTYSFPYTDPKSFVALSQILEGVGVSAYTGAAQLITNKDYLTAAATILSTEARHASWVASAINKLGGWSTSFDSPLSLNQVFTLAATFIQSCPSSNPTLPVHAFPSLTFTGASQLQPGQTATFSVSTGSGSSATSSSAPTHIVFFTGLDKLFVNVTSGSQVQIPENLSGQVYAIATTSGTDVTDVTTVAGPAILMFNRDSNNNLIKAAA